LAWLRQSVLVDGATYSRVLLHLLERLDALEATNQLNAEAWASMRRASADYHRRLQNLEAAQQQPADHVPGATKMVPAPQAAPPTATAEGLVEKVAPYCQDNLEDASTVIRVVAAWLHLKGSTLPQKIRRRHD
jgi:hypothetical protein